MLPVYCDNVARSTASIVLCMPAKLSRVKILRCPLVGTGVQPRTAFLRVSLTSAALEYILVFDH